MDNTRQQHPFPGQLYLIITGGVGLLFSVLATMQLFWPTLGILAQFPLLSPLARLVVIIKLLSPLLSFLLVAGWVWILLQVAQWVHAFQGQNPERKRHPISERQSLQTRRAVRQRQKRDLPQEHTLNDVSENARRREKRMTPPPALFQLDPTRPWNTAELPSLPSFFTTNAARFLRTEQEEQTYDDQADEKEQSATTQAEQTSPSQALDASSPHQQGDESLLVSPTSAHFLLQKPAERSETRTVVTLAFLKQIKAWVQADDGTSQEVKLRGGENAIRLIQLAYIAWRQGAPVDKD